ncbi:hypothetical protein BDQ17DRAFT_1360229 [Cyathus striatus]|nr:hypothetical protein BDQ17DRAFT_1360229 [Cyathus striatus]
MSASVESYTNMLTFVGGLQNCLSLDGPHGELRRILSHHEAYPDTLKEVDFVEVMFALRKLYHTLAEKGGADYAHPEPYYNAVFRICANVQCKRNNVSVVMPPASTGVKRRRAKVIKSVETVDSDSDVEVVTTQAPAPVVPAVPAAPVALVPVVTVPSVAVLATDASLNSTDMIVDDTAAPTPVVTQPATEARPEAVSPKNASRRFDFP